MMEKRVDTGSTGTARAETPGALVDRLCRVTNNHDLEALVDCFAEDYVNEAPAHPARGFRGRDQVRRNWEQILGAIRDFNASVRWVEDGSTVWSEWDMHGTLPDGRPHRMAGVVVFGVEDGRFTWARFYLEPVDPDTSGVDEAIRSHLHQDAASEAAARQPAGGR